MFRFARTIFVLLIITTIALSASGDLRVIQSDAHSMIIEWTVHSFKQENISEETGKQFTYVSFLNARHPFKAGQPDIPQRLFTIGIPEDGSANIQILSQTKKTIHNISLAPVPTLTQQIKGVPVAQLIEDQDFYRSNNLFPKQSVALLPVNRFRDITTQKVVLNPVQFNPKEQTLTYTTQMRLQITYNNPHNTRHPYEQRGLLDALYKDMLLNFDVAQHWQISRPAALRKTSGLPTGTWYRISINEDGLYKIGLSTLISAGIDVNNLNIHDIRMFNNSGHMLSYQTNATQYNPAFTEEIPITTIDQNNNGLLDDNDYILFYGKQVNGWFYDAGAKEFKYQEHLYATENVYWLVLSSGNGLRMEESALPAQSGAIEETYYMERFHFEEEQYNLLASGPDWYGHRFFGLSDHFSQDFELHPDLSIAAQPEFRIQLKGGSGVKYYDNSGYKYYFDISLNSNTLFTNKSFTTSAIPLYQTMLPSPQYLRDGENTLSIQYRGNLDGCSAHLDWFEVWYPHDFKANNNYLQFYSRNYTVPVRYTIRNMTAANDVFVFDVSDPLHVNILAKNLSVNGNTLSFDLPASEHPQAILVTSLSSPDIKPVANLKAVEHTSDLTATGNQADFIIITDKSFMPYAEELANMRSPLSSKVVSTEQVYMDFNSGVPDPTAIRNFIRYAYSHWQTPAPSYVLLFGDAHYDYRNIAITDTMRVPTFEIFATSEIDSRMTDNYFVDLNYTSDNKFRFVSPDLAIGRIPVQTKQQAADYLDKLIQYEQHPSRDGWQTVLTFVADDNTRPGVTSEYFHQKQTEDIARLSQLRKFNKNKVYLSAYPSAPGGFGRIKPEANNALIDYLNQGTLMVNYIGHGSPTQWAHESVFSMNRDLERIQNEGKLTFLIAATCDFGKFDDPHEPSFTEELIWQKNRGTIGALASTRLAFSSENAKFNTDFNKALFPSGQPSVSLGMAKLLSTESDENDQKFVLFADPTMHLADPRDNIHIVSITPDTLKALSEVTVQAQVEKDSAFDPNFNGDAMLLVNDARYDSVITANKFAPVTLPGPSIFRGQISVTNGLLTGKFILPKTIRYVNKNTGKLTLYAWNEQSGQSAIGYNDQLLFNGSIADIADDNGPEMDIYFKDQENFSSGDLIPQNPILIATLQDERGINITGTTGHTISIQVDQEAPKSISGFFTYEKDSYTKGTIQYPLEKLSTGKHHLTLSAFDNLNNAADISVDFKISDDADLVLDEVVNYPNPFSSETKFTFQTNREGADLHIKIYTINGRIIRELEGISVAGYNDELSWDGRDEDGDLVANGIYLYKIILTDNGKSKEVIEKMVRTR